MPNRWRINCSAFLIGVCYLCYQFMVKKENVPFEFFISQGINTFYFLLSSVVLSYKVKALYTTILANEKLIQENNRLLEMFPHGVVIQLQEQSNKDMTYFINEEFKQKIYNIDQKLDELKSIQIGLKPDKFILEDTGSFKTNLYAYLKNEQQKLKELTVSEDFRVHIWCKNSENPRVLDNLESEKFDERIFHI